MKQLLVTLLLLLVASISNEQYVLNLKRNFERNYTKQEDKDFDVVAFEGKKATELFDKAKKHVALAFRSPKEYGW